MSPRFQPPEKSFDLVAFEHEVLAHWEKSQAFAKLRAQNAGKKRWSFLDGPITANNPMGVHHAWGRTLKDAYQRYHAMTGHDQRYQNGFDCQGLWVEVEVEKELGFKSKRDIEAYGLEEFINRCKERVRKFSAVQTEQSIRLGFWMDWNDSYFTMSDENNYTIWSFLAKCHARGLIYKGQDAMPWCPRCGTGISEQETKEGYQDTADQAVFIKLPLVERSGEFLLVWTTTPWTLAANVACAVNPELTYARIKQGGDILILSKDLLSIAKEKGAFEVLEEVQGASLVGMTYRGPFDDLPAPAAIAASHRVIAWKEVSATDGTGIVHIAPGCGKEDFLLGRELGLPVLAPIDESGIYVGGFGFLSGQFAGDVADAVLDALRERGVYYKKETVQHRYPHCWRCKTKLLFRAVAEWYIRMDWRDEIKEVARQIRWIPEYGLDLELDWLTNMGDWMISKKRYWGLALPIYECACGNFEVIGSRAELEERAIAGWAEFDGNSPHRPWVDAVEIACSKCGAPTRRIKDVGNPWLDAGIVPFSTMRHGSDPEYWNQWYPADLVLECFPGQFRNWFYALLSMSTMMANRAPFKTLLGHALVRDEHGKEMHKSDGNAIWFDDAAEKAGVDSMRWLYCRQNPTLNLNFGYTITDQIKKKIFLTWWNVYSFFINYAIADDFDPARARVPVADRQDIDRWLLSKLQELIRTARVSMESFDAPTLIRDAEEFIDSLSTWYVRRCRRRFWRARNQDDRDKLAAYQTLHETLVTLCKVLAPVVPFIAEKLYANLARAVDPSAPVSVHLNPFPEFDPALHDEALTREMDAALRIVSIALGVREAKSLRVRQPLASMTVVPGSDAARRALARFRDHILDELNVKELVVRETLGDLATYSVQPNGKLLGPRLGAGMGAVTKALKAADPAAISRQVAAAVAAGGVVTLATADGAIELKPDEILVRTSFAESLAAGEDRGITVVLDVRVTPELEREGYARDIVRHIQTHRRDLDLDLADRIKVIYQTEDPFLLLAITDHAETIKGETLALTLERAAVAAAAIDLGDRQIALHIEKA